VVVGGCGYGWISLGKSSDCDYGREFSWNKTTRLRPDPAGYVDNTGGDIKQSTKTYEHDAHITSNIEY